MAAAFNLLALLAVAILALVLGERSARAVSTIMLIGVVATIFVQRVSGMYAPGAQLFVVDLFMVGAFFFVAATSDRRWVRFVLWIQILILALSLMRTLGLLENQYRYLDLISLATYGHAGLVVYALADRFFGSPVAAPEPEPASPV